MLTILMKIKKKLFEEKEDEMIDSYDYVIQPSDRHINLIEAIDLFQTLMKQFNQI